MVDAVLILFFFPGGIVSKLIEKIFGTELLKQDPYPIFFGVIVGGIFLTALVIAIRTIQKEPSPLPDFTERKAIKGLRAYTKEDAEIFARLKRERDLSECLVSITNETFRIGILMGESGVGKSSFLQAGIIPQLAAAEGAYQGVYIRFSNQEPIVTIYRALAEKLQLSTAETTETNSSDLRSIFTLAVATANKPLILIFDQFEQFFVHFKQQSDREPFINALKDWYCADNALPIKILISIRGDLADRLIELQKALGYSLSPYEVLRLEKFTPKSATKILQEIAQQAEIPFDEKFMLKLTREELASREDGLISPVDLQVLALTIERQDSELQAFKDTTFQTIGGIEGLMTRYLKTTLDARVIPRQREAAIKVLLAMIDLEPNVRAGALTIEEILQKTGGTLKLGEIDNAVTWLARGEVRLITTIEQDGDVRYELAHERLIPALREIAGKKLTTADELLDRRVNEWLGNNRQSRYLFNWQEWRLIQQQKPYLVWGANQSNKRDLLKCSKQKLYRQLVVVAIALVLCLVGTVWWHTPWGQIQQVRWQLARLSERVSLEYKAKAASAFAKDVDLNQLLKITDSIDNPYKAEFWLTIAQTYGKLNKTKLADKYLTQAATAAEQIDDSSDKAKALEAIAQTYGKLNKTKLADKYLTQAATAAEQIDDSSDKAKALEAIAQTYGKLNNIELADKYLTQAATAAKQIDDSSDKAWALGAIAKTYGKLNKTKLAGEYLTQAVTAAKQIDGSSDKAWVSLTIAQAYGKLNNNIELADKYLTQAVTTAEQIDDSSDKAWVLKAIAQTYGKLNNNIELADKYLTQAVTTTEQIDDSFDKARALEAIVETQVELDRWRQAYNTVFKCPDDHCKVKSLAHILTAWAEKKNPALIVKEED